MIILHTKSPYVIFLLENQNVYQLIEVKLQGLFKSAYRNTFADVNVRYMNLDGIRTEVKCLYEADFIGVGIGQTYTWDSGFTVSYRWVTDPRLVLITNG